MDTLAIMEYQVNILFINTAINFVTRWEKVKKKGRRKSDVQILSYEASVVEYQLL